jgi:hypothetical protein
MKRVQMTDLQTSDGDRTFFVPGGWYATIPEVRPDDAALRAFKRYLQEDGLTEWAAEMETLDIIQSVFESAYLRGIRHMLYARVKEYARRWPELVQPDGTLQGFDPAALQGVYFPFDRPGRRGKVYADTAMAQMAREAEAEGAVPQG